jgi:signal transduction histidine kinase
MHIATLADPGPTPIAPPVRYSHSAQFYRDDAYLIDELSRYIGTALIAGESSVVIATKAHRESLAKQLRSRGLEITLAIEQGRYVALDAAETMARFMRDGWPDAALFTEVADSILRPLAAAAGAHPHISAFGEMVALLWEQGNSEGAVRLEQLWNEVLRIYPMSLRCAYPIHNFDRELHGDSLLEICAEHNHVIPVESYTALITEEERQRSIIYLQQKAQALETEMRERKQVEETLRRTQSELENLVEQRTSALRQLTSRLLSLQDTERRRIARELHDSLGQYLVGLKLNIDMLRQTPASEQMWSETEQLMQKCMSEVRTLSYLLHPPTMDAAGFVSAARWYVEGFGQRSGITVTLDTPENLGRLPARRRTRHVPRAAGSFDQRAPSRRGLRSKCLDPGRCRASDPGDTG